MLRPKVYLVGASGVGKTTLATALSQLTGLPMLSGATQLAREELGATWDDIFLHPDVADVYQKMVFQKQQEIEAPYWSSEGQGFISDRSFDLLAYTAEMAGCLHEIVCGQAFYDYMQRVKHHSLVLFLRPHPQVKAKKDGRRDRFLNNAFVYRVDGVIQYILEGHRVPYVPISTPSLRERLKIGERLIKLATHK